MNVWDANWLVIDTETTGPDPATCSIVELGAVPFQGGQPGPRMGTLLNPLCPIPPEAAAVHGITDDQVAEAPTLLEVVDRFLARVEAADVLVGYNILHFDEPVLRRAIGPAWTRTVQGKPVIDPLVIVRLNSVGRWWRGPGRHRLTSVCERFGISAPGRAHRASADCVMTGLLLWYLRTHDGCQKLPTNAHELDIFLRKAAVEQQAEFERWRASQPEPAGGAA